MSFIAPGMELGAAGAHELCGGLLNILSENGNLTLIPRNHPRYTDLRSAHWSATAWKQPDCIFVPTSVEELGKAIPIIERQGDDFAIRSGGHMPAIGGASVDDGILIDLSSLNRLEYDAESQTVVAGTGLRYEDLYHYLDQYEVTVVGGRTLNVGLGGFPLGCGLSYLSDLYGLACDNVVNFEVVLAGGSIVNANMKENSDLFFALKGGSNNFGIVTAFTFKTYPINKVWGGTRIFSWDKLDAVLDALLEYQNTPDKDPHASLNLNAAVTNQTDIGIILTLVYLKPEEKPKAFEPFYKIETLMDTSRVQTLTSAMSEFPSPNIPRIRFLTSTFKPSKTLHESIKDIMQTSDHIKTIQSLIAGTVVFTWQAISPSLVEAGKKAGGNALGLEAVPQTWFHIDSLWWNAEDDEITRAAGHSLMAEVVTAAKKDGSHIDFIFLNDADAGQDMIASYGKENVAKLLMAQEKHDPHKFFHKHAAGAFKVQQEEPPPQG